MTCQLAITGVLTSLRRLFAFLEVKTSKRVIEIFRQLTILLISELPTNRAQRTRFLFLLDS